ncbi:GNAT family N-acetyltransferase [Cryobacterium sp. CG_9.6]|uniref:GNAT family N-acetyltransferase n=1 Tax=Cryobacterium sp. CG_9.6 TaxID=2760710 RepID=UPI0024766C5F|nr:GNAT family N-acetyltransferase [Cryobacterium sp. CG_9.6]MDH6238174.1 GNAT superfamily N-acetyltransferase [Cryobacterium sp. CG_9.6]
MNTPPSAPRKLERADNRESFHSGAAELDIWLKKYASQNQKANSAVTYVTCVDGEVVGYYAITVAAISHEEAPSKLRKQAPRQIPCVLIARLAVDLRYAGQGVGAGLLEDALRRSLQVSESVGAMAVLIHARDEVARSFCEHHVDCYPSPLDDLQLMIPMAQIARVYGTPAT